LTHSPYALVVDDHPLVGRGVAEFLKAHHLLADVLAVGSGSDMLAAIARLGDPAVVLIDFWLATGASDALVAQLRRACPATKIVVISGDDNPAVMDKARVSGAHGFLHKQDAPRVFFEAVSAVLCGLVWFRPHVAHTTAGGGARDLPVTPIELGLTSRQGQILALLLQGLSNKRIAQALSLSENTVKEHITAILQRLAVSNRVEAIMYMRGRKLALD
jgi:DNA-binding NarL/FixJ family response regulator